LILEYADDVFIIELKKQSPEVSLKQIRDKQYGLKYEGRNLYFVGIEIDDENRNLGKWRITEGVDVH
jgi:hypothetical protein